MPRLGQSVETCIITKWFKNKGDSVKEGDILFSYETDKASFEETAQISGTLLDVFFEEGDELLQLDLDRGSGRCFSLGNGRRCILRGG